MKRTILILAALALLILGVSPVGATPITYVEQAVATGELGSTAFTDALVTLTYVGDTINIQSSGTGLFGDHKGTATVNVAGIGTATFTDKMIAAVTQNTDGGLYPYAPSAEISDHTSDLLICATSNPIFATYDLSTAIGPISGTALWNGGALFPTTDGNFLISIISGDATFTATTSPVPIPGALLLLAPGLASVAAVRRKFKK